MSIAGIRHNGLNVGKVKVNKRGNINKLGNALNALTKNIIGNVEGKTCILLDDMVDTAGSLVGAAKAIVEIGGAKEVYACASHGVLSGPAIERIENSCIKELLLLDTIPYPENAQPCDKIKYMSVAPVFAEAIQRVYEEISISNLFE